MLRLTAFLLPIDDIEVDLGWVGNGLVSIGRYLNKQHILHGGIVRQQKKSSHLVMKQRLVCFIASSQQSVVTGFVFCFQF